ncbi:SprT family protein [Aquibacillus sediminis]|uniref:SprT family protein n=1 Tax=Aquibacillus sediminis TaxID=2574734 RepID=UPI0011094CE2|nr:SprT family protein [Aquibacillus sediminis]
MSIMTQAELEELVNQLSLSFFNKPFVDDVAFNFRLRTTGGRYIPNQRKIELNPKYLDELDYDEFCGIIKHELCHYHLHIEGKGYNHRDKDFRELLRKTGSPRFCSPLPSMEKQVKYQYKCLDCGHVYHRVRIVNTQKYRCGKCRGKLKKIKP